VAYVGLVWDGYSHIRFGRDGHHWTPSHLLLKGSAFPLILGYLLLAADELKAARDRGGQVGLERWLRLAIVLGFMMLLGALDILFSPWLQKRAPNLFVPRSAAGWVVWLVAANRVFGRPGAATLAAVLFLLWRELLSFALVLSNWDRPPHLGAMLVLSVAIDLLFLAAGRWSRHPLFGAAAGTVAGAVYALPAYVLALAVVAEREGTPAGPESRWGALDLADVAPQRALLVIGVTVVGAALSGLAGQVVGSLVLAQRQVALRRAPPKRATAGRPSTAT
jgi:hypothetical protein